MLHAAKRRDPVDSNMAMGFVNHALDEYKHTGMFRDIISLFEKSNPTVKIDTMFSPVLAVNKGYINPNKFLFDNMELKRFSVFIGVNERSAHNLFTKLINRLDSSSSIELSITDTNAIKNALELILKDEERHSNLAFSYSEIHISRPKLMYYKFLENTTMKIRSFYASQGAISRAVATFIYTVVIALIYPMRFAITLPEKDSHDLLNPERENLMI